MCVGAFLRCVGGGGGGGGGDNSSSSIRAVNFCLHFVCCFFGVSVRSGAKLRTDECDI